MFDDRAALLGAGWSKVLAGEFQTPYMRDLEQFLENERTQGKVIFPPAQQFFRAFKLTPLKRVKIVILGQDPYHGPHQAQGLSFSVAPGLKIPPSLRNIFKELHRDLDVEIPSVGCLDAWAKQGVLLLNATLSVEQSNAGSHQGKGWEAFTDKVIEYLNTSSESVVFMLWGSYAQKKGQLIDRGRHCVLTAPHPSPLSAHRGFLGCGHFSKANTYLQKHQQTPIDWRLI